MKRTGTCVSKTTATNVELIKKER